MRFRTERSGDVLGDVEVMSGPDGRFTVPNAWTAEFGVSVFNLPPGTFVKRIAYSEQNLLASRRDHTKRVSTSFRR